jgi:hypothetical protein
VVLPVLKWRPVVGLSPRDKVYDDEIVLDHTTQSRTKFVPCCYFEARPSRWGRSFWPYRDDRQPALLDWGACGNPAIHRAGLLTFEHQDCPEFEQE